MVERIGDKRSVGQGCGLSKQTSLVSIIGEISYGDPRKLIDRGVQASLMKYRSDMSLGTGSRIKDDQKGRAEKRAALMQGLSVIYIYLMSKIGCRYHGSALGASKPWTEGVGRYGHEPSESWQCTVMCEQAENIVMRFG